LLSLVCGDAFENRIINCDRRCAIAAPQAAYVLNLDFVRAGSRESPRKFCAEFARAVQPAAHIRAHQHFRVCRGRQTKMRVEARYAMDLVERRLRALRKAFELSLWQIPMAQLDGAQFVKDH